MQPIPPALARKLFRALQRNAVNGRPTVAHHDGYGVRVRGIDPFTGAAEKQSSASVELWNGSFSHSVGFEILDPDWPRSQWQLLHAALSQCLDTRFERR